MLKQFISRSHEKNAKRAFRDFIRPKIELSRIIHSRTLNRLQNEAILVPHLSRRQPPLCDGLQRKPHWTRESR
jgi:hypothetical protein